ncbi:MAG: hypothetical protein JSR37_06360 [Verrucomicrobia bacterium]|nr:hypothetical protein [Verrucomicrobiota bacterium]
MNFRATILAICLSLSLRVYGELPSMSELLTKSLNIKLEAPTYKDGVTYTDKGGVVTGKDLYLQAEKMKYTNNKTTRTIEASGDLFFRFKNRIYTGERLEYDLNKQTAIIYNVHTDAGLWYLSGSKLSLNADGSGVIDDCRMTTDENVEDDWTIEAKEVHVSKNNTLKAQNVRFMVFEKPIFWIPSLSKDLNNDSMSPIKYRVSYYKRGGVRLGLSYSFDMGDNWKNKVLCDVSTRRGLAGGFATEYKNPNKKESFSAFNYYAHDIATNDSDRKDRYRFQGKYANKLFDDKLGVIANYDKLSDPEFPADFTSRGLDSARAKPTQAQATIKDPNWISSLNTKVRINTFQSVKQQLPLFTFNMRPFELGESKVVIDNRFNAGYLDYQYARKTPDVHNFHSSRVDLAQKVSRPCPVGIFTITPHAGYQAIGYGNSPQHDSKLLAQGILGVEAHTRFRRQSHIVEPYLQYDYYSNPTVNPHKHYLFDLQDGLYRQDMLRFGARNFMQFGQSQLNFDLYGRAFFNSPKIGSHLPKVYLDSVYRPSGFSQYTLNTAWDLQHNLMDHFNLRGDFTFSDDIAMALEYRHRSAYAWRKTDYSNFMIDTFRSQHRLRHSLMSDKRDTFLTHFFVRLMPQLALELRTRHGWGRKHAHHYNEYEVNCISLFRNTVTITLTFRHRSTGNDYGIDISFGRGSHSDSIDFKKIGQGTSTNLR